MIRRSREVNIFSMSALDLFASALGAFIFISITLFPYFTNTTKSLMEELEKLEQEKQELSDRVAEVSTELAQERGRLNQANQEKAKAEQELEKERARVKLPPLDVVFVMDTTGSMRNEIVELGNQIGNLVELLNILSDDVAVGIVEYKDIKEPISSRVRSYPLLRVENGTPSLRNLRSFIRNLKAGGSVDNYTEPEAMDEGLQAAYSLAWRKHSRRQVVIVIADQPPFPFREQAAVRNASAFIAVQEGRRIAAVHAGDRRDAEPFLRKLVSVGQGRLAYKSIDALTIVRLIMS